MAQELNGSTGKWMRTPRTFLLAMSSPLNCFAFALVVASLVMVTLWLATDRAEEARVTCQLPSARDDFIAAFSSSENDAPATPL